MIRAARSRHRIMIVALALVVPPLFIAGLMLRQPIPVTEAGPSTRLSEGQTIDELPIRVSWPGRRTVRLTLDGPLLQPDLLAYWGEEPLDAARLLGPVGGGHAVEWQLPPTDGKLLIYSTAWKRVVGSASPPTGWSSP